MVNNFRLLHLVLPNPVLVIADLRPFSKLIGFFVAFFWREFIYMIDRVWLSHIPLLSYVPTNLNCVYFNFNFCIENWQQTISFLKLESNLMINAVSVKESSETLLHLFWECLFVKSFWNEISNWMTKSSCFLKEEFSFLSCIGLVNDTTNPLFHHALLTGTSI